MSGDGPGHKPGQPSTSVGLSLDPHRDGRPNLALSTRSLDVWLRGEPDPTGPAGGQAFRLPSGCLHHLCQGRFTRLRNSGQARLERASCVAVSVPSIRIKSRVGRYLVALLLTAASFNLQAEEYGSGRYLRCAPGADAVLPPALAAAVAAEAGSPPDPGSVIVESDYAELEEAGNRTFTGDVEAVRGELALRGQRLVYDENSGVVDVLGAAEVWNASLFWQGEHARTELDSDNSLLETGHYQLRESPGHGTALRVEDRPQESLTLVEQADYTTCPGDRPSWRLRFSRLKMDHAEERAHARNLVIYAGRVPVFYTPFMSFPLSDKRQSGLLTPTFGTSNKNSIDFSIPYYWNIAPEYDATLGPRHLGERGTMFEGEFRYLVPTGGGQLGLNWLPSDRSRNDESRVLFRFDHQQTLFENRATAFVTYATVSDRNYFEDFGNSLSTTSQQFLEQRLDLSGAQGPWGGLFRVQSFQSVDPSLASSGPYKRLPQLLVYGTPISGGNGRPNLTLTADLNYFDRDASVVGGRLDTRTDLSLPFSTASGFITPRIGARIAQYSLTGDDGFDASPGRVIPVASLDSGVYFERNARLFGGDFVQTLEPRLYYLYVADQNQDRFPVFDSGLYDFTFAQLFRDDRFAGGDRVGDANQLTTALTSRVFDRRGGRERMRINLGQILYFDNQDVTLPGTANEPDASSELVGEITLRPLRALRLLGNITWDPNIPQTRRGTVGMRYAPDPQHVFNLGYRVRRDIAQVPTRPTLEQIEASARWPIYGGTSGVGRWVYSLADQTTIESFGGLEYDSCCWATRAVVRRYVTTATNQYDTGVFLQVELKGLTGIGANTKGFLERYVPGYRSEF
jgi:LPS-assembly protein